MNNEKNIFFQGSKISLLIKGMNCSRCVTNVERVLNNIDGVEAKVDLGSRTAKLNLTKSIPENVIRETLDEIGYDVQIQ